MDLSLLTKQQLQALLAEKEKLEAKENNVDVAVCKYKPLKAGYSPCQELPSTAWGYCKKHSRTVQARQAQREYEEKNRPSIPQETEEPSIDLVSPEPGPKPNVSETLEESQKEAEEIEKEAEENSKKVEVRKPSTNRKPAKPKKGVKKRAAKKKVIRKNQWGKYEDPDSHIVFDPVSKVAYGVQDSSGKVFALSEHHIRICQVNGWDYNDLNDSSSEEYESSSEESSSEETSEDYDSSEETSENISSSDVESSSEEESSSDESY